METRTVNNAIYAELGNRWYDASDDPVALLRAEAGLRNPWIVDQIGPEPCSVLDMGCGAGYLANELAGRGHRVTGIDLAAQALEVAAAHDATETVAYRIGDATALDFPSASFDAVCATDILEHVEEPARVVAEAARLLRPGGKFFFHTFNRTRVAWLIVIKGVEWFVKNTPRDMHILRLFIKPAELAAMCRAHGLEPVILRGLRPRVDRAFFRMLATGRVGRDFRFVFTDSLRTGYTGFARRR
jgi:2-polyprenyl-6-hydroxyphenyl methylase / 3-demethylubiquinone-9 3-methyltransferase